MAITRLVSVLFVPGIRPPMFEKAKTAPADVICLDLEDSVAIADKAQARAYVAGAVAPCGTRKRSTPNEHPFECPRDPRVAVHEGSRTGLLPQQGRPGVTLRAVPLVSTD